MNTALATDIKSPSVTNGILMVLKPAYNGHRYVVASFAGLIGDESETMIFPANQYGEVTCFDELSVAPGYDVSEAFKRIDYIVKPYERPVQEPKLIQVMIGNIPLLQWLRRL